ncbi:MAG: [FeFe] hydrogenase H-cluster radical SAM maturase HydG, partial [Candidatus Omnitrophica bacterium]|nr:[FeFe] hydrogenase H-cluster radical SAM maturase HydG [Candidatus Omnitrophota bacterium]
PAIRSSLFELGVSQISAGSRTNPGGYAHERKGAGTNGQFSLGDTRPLDEVIRDIVKHDCIPSFCTACYRLGRTGNDFMELAKPGLIQQFCQPNAFLTFKEYLEDYASKETKKLGEELLENEKIKFGKEHQAISKKFNQRLKRIEEGERDLYF